MIYNFDKIKERHYELEALLTQEKIMRDAKKYTSLRKEYKELSQIVCQIIAWEKNQKAQQENLDFLQAEKDEEILVLAKEEQVELERQALEIDKTIKQLLLPKDSNDNKSIILELRAGTGGDEASLWVGDLFRMYQRFAEGKRWGMEIISFTEGGAGGYKEIISNITGKNVYGFLKYESGVHRVQRVPHTETQGRIHTSAASVVVLPEIDEVEIQIDMNEVKKETFCSSGPGGQSVNTTYSAVRLTHIPTGISASCQDGKSQIKNFEKALKVLRARLYERAHKAQQEKVEQKRKIMVGSGDRSAKIRTYNFPRAWVNDHRINYTNQNLPNILSGQLDRLIEALRLADQKAKFE